VVTPPPPTEEELRAEEEERHKNAAPAQDPNEPAPIVAQWAGEHDDEAHEPPERELPKQGLSADAPDQANDEPRYIPSRPPDDPGIGDEDEDESDLDRFRRAHS
jgi:hypothetical protein